MPSEDEDAVSPHLLVGRAGSKRLAHGELSFLLDEQHDLLDVSLQPHWRALLVLAAHVNHRHPLVLVVVLLVAVRRRLLGRSGRTRRLGA